MKAISFKLIDLLQEIKAGAFVIPRFQREFVWDPSATCKLIDSIARGYPIGALLTLPKEALELPSQALDYEGAESPEQEAPQRAYYLLDGQQRLTSIARSMLQGDPGYAYFFDLEAMYRELVLEEDTDLDWVVARRHPKGKRKPNQSGSLLPCSDAIEGSIAIGTVLTFLKEKDPASCERDLLAKGGRAAPLLKVLEVVRNYDILVHQMERDEPLEAVCRIFETINNTGVKLDTFDLVVAKNYSSDYNLREDLDRVKLKYPDTRHISGEPFLHVIHFYSRLCQGKRPELTRSGLLATEASVWTQNLDKAAIAFVSLLSWIDQQRLSLPGKEDLVPVAMRSVLAAAEMSCPGGLARQIVSIQLKRWILATLWETPSYNKSTLVNDLVKIKNFLGDAVDQLAPVLPLPSMAQITAEDVMEAGPSSRRYKVLQAIVTASLSHDILGGVISNITVLEDHHIFPKALCAKRDLPKKLRDSLANRIMVTKETNNRLIKDHTPEHYFSDAVAMLGESEAARLFNDSLITYESIEMARYSDSDSFETVLQQRAALIANKANQFFRLM